MFAARGPGWRQRLHLSNDPSLLVAGTLATRTLDAPRALRCQPMTDDLAFLDATAQAELVERGDLTPLDLVDAAINRVEKVNPELNAVIHPLFDRARAAARGDLPPGLFRGVPAVVKDLDGSSAGDPSHLGNRLLKAVAWTDDHDSYLFAKLRAAGFVFVGKTNTPELGLQPTTEPLSHGPTRNPWDTGRGPGGSSGGSATAVAAGMVPVGHAGDGGGSIRIPASACGIFGLKPSRGRVSLGPDAGESWAGMVQRHVVTRSVRDSAAVLDAVAGEMPGDPYTAPPPVRPFAHEVGADPGNLRIGLRTNAPGDMVDVHPDCVAAAEDAARLLESLGHTVDAGSPAPLDEPDLMGMFMTIISTWVVKDLEEIACRAGREVGPDDVEPLTWAYAEMGRTHSGVQYVNAVNAMHAWSRRVAAWWTPAEGDGHDLLLTPTMAEPPPLLGDLVPPADNPLHGAARATPFATFTAPFNVTGQPAMSVPLQWSGDGLPVGAQLVAASGREDVLIRVASQLETARPWADRRPPVHA
jgi:amidase